MGKENQSKFPTWYGHVISGACSGIVSALVCAPLDVAKIRMQVQFEILHESRKYRGVFSTLKLIFYEEGVPGLFKGLVPTLCTVPCFWALYFPLYNHMKSNIQHWFDFEESDTKVYILAAISSGFCVDITTNPLWMIRTRMVSQKLHTIVQDKHQFDSYRNVYRAFRKILSEEGITAFWKGTTASFLGLGHVAIQFPLYEKLKELSRERNNGSETTMDIIGASAISKFCGSFVTYPHEVLRSRMQDSRVSLAEQSLRRTIHTIYSQEGIKGLYAGFSVNLVRVLPNCIFTFLVYESILKHFFS